MNGAILWSCVHVFLYVGTVFQFQNKLLPSDTDLIHALDPRQLLNTVYAYGFVCVCACRAVHPHPGVTA